MQEQQPFHDLRCVKPEQIDIEMGYFLENSRTSLPGFEVLKPFHEIQGTVYLILGEECTMK